MGAAWGSCVRNIQFNSLLEIDMLVWKRSAPFAHECQRRVAIRHRALAHHYRGVKTHL